MGLRRKIFSRIDPVAKMAPTERASLKLEARRIKHSQAHGKVRNLYAGITESVLSNFLEPGSLLKNNSPQAETTEEGFRSNYSESRALLKSNGGERSAFLKASIPEHLYAARNTHGP
jgi:hypothetical protein